MHSQADVFVTRHQRMVYAYLLALTGDHHLSEDLTQETFLIAWRKMGKGDEVRDAGAWLRGIAKRVAWDEFRKSRRRPLYINEAVAAAVEQIQCGGEKEDRLKKFLDECFDGLSETARGILKMRYERGMSAIEIGAAVGKSQDNVNMMLSRSRGVLRECMEKKMSREDGTP